MKYLRDTLKNKQTDYQTNPPRKHHYLFAHRFLRDIFFENPIKYAYKNINLYFEDPLNLYTELWKYSGKTFCDFSEIIEPNGLDVKYVNIRGNFDFSILTLPTPKYVPEAYYIALVFLYNPEDNNDLIKTKYYTLEKSFGNTTCVCGWDYKIHHNYCISIDPQIDAFISVITILNSI